MKKIFLFLAISLFSIPAMHAVVTWNGTTSKIWTQGTGTAADPYLIETPANLAYLSAQVSAGNTYTGVYFLQTEDFNLNSKTWKPIGSDTYKFSGIYDGGNKYISNPTESLFGHINNATIQNLILQGNELSKMLTYSDLITACLVKCTYGECQLINCHNKIESMDITYNNGDSKDGFVGGLVGCAKGSKLEMIQCSNASIFYHTKLSSYSSMTYFGGLLGGASSGEIYIDKCYNTSKSIVNSGYAQSASLAGDLSGASNILMQRSYSKGDANMAFILYGNGAIKGCYHIGNINNNYYSGGNRITAITTKNAIKSNCYVVLSNYSSQEGWGNKTTFCFQTGGDLENGTYLSNEQMKQSSFLPMLNTLGDYFTMDLEGINDGYPILKWQAGPRYTITGSCDANRGTVEGGGEYAPGNTATLTATPKKGCTFIGWSDGNTDNPRTVTVGGDATYIAQFTKSNYTIYVNQDCTSYIE